MLIIVLTTFKTNMIPNELTIPKTTIKKDPVPWGITIAQPSTTEPSRPSTAPPPKGGTQQARHALTLRLTSESYDRLYEFVKDRRMRHQTILENALTEYLDKYEE